MKNLTDSEIVKVHAVAKTQVSVACDEFHHHTALKGCLVGRESRKDDDPNVVVCKLCETILAERRAMRAIASP